MMAPYSTDRVHYGSMHDVTIPACKSLDRHPVTALPRRVTCARCMRTRAYREMMEDR